MDPGRALAAIACLSCRRLKMKCIGSETPPCARCAKAGRECIVQRPDRRQNSINPTLAIQSHGERSSQALSNSATGSQSHRVFTTPRTVHTSPDDEQSRDQRPEPISSPANSSVSQLNQSILPSIYSTPPYAAVLEQRDPATPDSSVHNVVSQSHLKRRRTASTGQGIYPNDSGDTGIEQPISERDMSQFIDFFRKRILVFIPVINPEDLEDIQEVISKKRQLANCICYVTARYVPGGESTRSRLYPAISAILQDRTFLKKTAREEWTTLQALSILYAYRPTTERDPSSAEISQRSTKAYIETYALHLSVHRSIEELRALIRAHDANIQSSISYKKYIYWLWLFNMSHHYSVVTGTPPSIREDSSIRIAPKLLANIEVGPRVRQILAEMELCLLWSEASVQERGLGEWWCPPDPSDTPRDYAERGVLDAVDSSLETWSQKWNPFLINDHIGPQIDFHFRFTRFCISTYLTRNLKLQINDPGPSQLQSLNRSVAAAAHFCRFALELGPVSKDALRYMGDFGFVMISFSCLFIIQACEMFGSFVTQVEEHLDTVDAMAQLMKELAINTSHGPGFQSQMISAKLQKAHEQKELRENDNFNGSEQAMTNQQFSFVEGQDEMIMIDPLWDLWNFFPDIPET